MSADAQTLTKALQYALDLLEIEPGMTKHKATEEAAKQFDLGPIDEEWLLNHLTAPKPAE
ncbi:MAG: hypothetical protein PCFJNLEI_04050 [Verrucomicrobiae bacterium]|nr:hypothetical protein [Verrucomicrobiae bacterium]